MRILVRAPNWLGDIVMCVPFMEALVQEFPDAEIQVIIKPEYLELLTLFPCKVKAYPFSKKEYPGLTGLHRYAHDMDEIYNVDLYFSLPPSFSSAFMGVCFRAKERVGYKGQWRSLLLTHKRPFPQGLHRTEEYLELLTLYTGKKYIPQKIMAKEVGPYFSDWETNKYIVVNCNSEAPARRLPNHQWVELFSYFENQRFVFIGTPKEKPRVDELIEILREAHGEKNKLLNIAGKTDIMKLAAVLAYAQGVVSNDSGPAHLASFMGAPLVVTNGSGSPKYCGPHYNKAPSIVLTHPVPCSPCFKNECKIKTLDCLEGLKMHEMADHMYELFRLEVTAGEEKKSDEQEPQDLRLVSKTEASS